MLNHANHMLKHGNSMLVCMRVRHFPLSDAHFLYDPFEGEAREEIKCRPREVPECYLNTPGAVLLRVVLRRG